MTRFVSLLLVILLVGPARGELTLVGRVMDSESNAIDRAVVRATPVDDEGLLSTAFADEAGAFSLPLERGRYELSLAGDLSPSWIGETVHVDVSDGLSTNEVVIVARRGAQIEGRVVVPDGAAVADAAVMTRRAGDDPAQASGISWTDASGAFRIGGLDPGDLRLLAEGPGGEKVSTTVVVSAGVPMTNIVLVLASGGIDGRVLDSEGNPRAKAAVLVASLDDAVGVEQTDEGGAFRFRGLADGEYVVMTMALDGGIPMRRVPVSVSDGRVTGGVVLRPGAITLCGRLLDDEAEPIADADIRVQAVDEELEASSIHAIAATDRDGRFCVSNLYAGAYKVLAASRPRGWIRVNRVDVAPDSGELSVVLGGGGEIAGRVVDEAGAVVTGAVVHAVLPGDAEVAGASGLTDGEGRFRFPRVRPGEYRLFATDGRRLTPWANIEVRPASRPAETELPLVSNGSVLSGRVTKGGEPVADAPVVVQHQWGVSVMAVEATDAEGRFSIPSLPGGQYRLSVMMPSMETVRRDVHVGDEAVVDVEMDL